MSKEELSIAMARFTDLVEYRKEVEAGRIRPAHDAEILAAMEEEALRVKILQHYTGPTIDPLAEAARAQGLVWV